MNLEIVLKKGLGDILFNSSIEEIAKIIGSPSEVEEIGEDIDYPTTILHYDDMGFSLFFDVNECSKLTCIDIDNKNAILFGEKIMSLSVREIEELMFKNNIFNETKEKEDWGEMRVSFEEYRIDFYFIDEQLVSATFGR